MDKFYVGYCVFHIVVSIAVDAGIALPSNWTHPLQVKMLDLHMSMNKDPLFLATPMWLQGFVWLEIIFQIPFFAWAAADLARGKRRVWPACLAYGIEASTTTFACLVEIWYSTAVESEAVRWKLLSVYVPTLLVPLIMAIDFWRRISKELSAKPKLE